MTKSRTIKVFLSSTCYDLVDLRQELRAFLEKNGFSVALSEDPRSPFIVDPMDDSLGRVSRMSRIRMRWSASSTGGMAVS